MRATMVTAGYKDVLRLFKAQQKEVFKWPIPNDDIPMRAATGAELTTA